MERVAVLIDGNNLAHGARRHGVVVDYGMVLIWCAQGGLRGPDGRARRGLGHRRHVVLGRVYLGPTHNGNGRRESFVDLMSALGLEVVVAAEEGDRSKTAVDRDIMLDALALAYGGKIDRILLLSGDGGFTRLVRMLQTLGVQVEVCAFPDASRALHDAANAFWDLTLLAEATRVREGGGLWSK